MLFELNPESFCLTFGVFIMRKKHSEKDRLHYMKMMEEGYSADYIHRHYGINGELLRSLWIRYQKEGIKALKKKKNIKAEGGLKEIIIKILKKMV